MDQERKSDLFMLGVVAAVGFGVMLALFVWWLWEQLARSLGWL